MDGWFPRLSLSGLREVRGSENLTIDRATVVPDGTGAVWRDERAVLFKRHTDGRLQQWTAEAGVEPVLVDGAPVVVNSVAAAGTRWAFWAEDAAGPYVRTSAGRVYRGFGGGMNPLDMAPDGTLVMGHLATGILHLVRWGDATPGPLRRGILPRCGRWGAVWEDEGRIWYASLLHPTIVDVTIPGERCMKPVLIDAPTGEWVLCHTHTRLLLFPLGSARGRVVAEGTTEWPDARFVEGAFRVVWSTGAGSPGEAPPIPLDAPLVDLSAPAVWHPARFEVDALPFLVPSYDGVLRCPEDGQTLQSVRTAQHEVACLKGSAERQERWRWDDLAVRLVYDASDKPADQPLQPWRVDPEPVWCLRRARVGDRHDNGPRSTLVRRRPDGRTTREPFPVTTGVLAYGEHVEVRGVGLCRVLVTRWAPNYPDGGYEERHWWAVRESDELRLGRVRYEEWRYAPQWAEWQLARAFDFLPSAEAPLAPAPVLPIPDPVPEEDPDPMPTIAFPPRDETLLFLTALEEFYAGTLLRPPQPALSVDREGLAVWLQEYLRLRVNGRGHDAAVAETIQTIRYDTGMDPRPQ